MWGNFNIRAKAGAEMMTTMIGMVYMVDTLKKKNMRMISLSMYMSLSPSPSQSPILPLPMSLFSLSSPTPPPDPIFFMSLTQRKY